MAPRPSRSQRRAASSKEARGAAKQASAAGDSKALQLSVECEARVRQLLQAMPTDADVAAPRDALAMQNDAQERRRKLGDAYDQVRDAGFPHEVAAMAFQSMPASSLDAHAAIDWMLLHAPTESLPARYRGGKGASEKKGDVKVVAAQVEPRETEARASHATHEEEQVRSTDATEAAERTDRPRKPGWKALDEDEAQWILRYVEQASSEEEWDETPTAAESAVLKATPSVEPLRPRSKAEAVAQMNEAKESAREAKKNGDTQAQKEASERARMLAQALREFPEEDAGPPVAQEERPDTNPTERAGDQGDEDDEPPALDLFDENNAETWGEPEAPTLTLEELGPSKVVSAKPKKAKQKPHTKAPAVKHTPPKALLQQHCTREDIPPPKFNKISGIQCGYKYTVTLDRVPSKVGGRRARRRDCGPLTFGEEEDAAVYDSIQDAQNAVATRALFALCSERPIHQVLPPVFAELWVNLMNQKLAQSSAPDQGKNKDQDDYDDLKNALISQVLSDRSVVDISSHEGCSGNKAGEDETLSRDSLEREIHRPFQEQELCRIREENNALKAEFDHWSKRTAGSRMQKLRSQLPVSKIKDDLLQILEEHDSVIVCGDTGCGKTTQIPQYIFDAAAEAGKGGWCNIVCTQPRRVAATSLAERVADEREGPAPGKKKCRIGYAVRLEHAATPDTKILYCTTGILLRRLAADPGLHGVSHVVLDEIHERTMQGDFLLALLRKLQSARRTAQHELPLKLVLMSATIDPSLFSEYLGNCPVLEAQGRTFPVKQFYLEEIYESLQYQLQSDSWAALRPHRGYGRLAHKKAYSQNKQHIVSAGWGDEEAETSKQILNPLYDPIAYERLSKSTRRSLAIVDESKIDYELVEDLLAHIDERMGEGAILVFLPGLAEIRTLKGRLSASHRFSDTKGRHLILPLHSTTPADEQRLVFRKPSEGRRKIVLSTNIAETSVTIDDIVFVVDTGRMREMRMDYKRGMSCLTEVWAPGASLRQRKGRAGRVQEGQCFTLLTKARIASLPEHALPEIARASLVDLVLQIKLMHLGNAASFLSECPEPPPKAAIEVAVRTLHEVGALDEAEELTSLGRHLARLPVDPRVGKLLIIGSALGTLNAALTISACLTYKSPFSTPTDNADAAERVHMTFIAPKSKSFAAGSESDHLAMVAAYQGWSRARQSSGTRAGYKYAKEHYLSIEALHMIQELREQFASLLLDVGFCKTEGHMPTKENLSKHAKWYDDSASPWNRNDMCAPVLKGVLCGALQPNVATWDRSLRKWEDGIQDVAIHPSSLLHPTKYSNYKHPFLVFHEKMKTSKVYLCDCTLVSAMAILLLGSSNLEVDHKGGTIKVLDRIIVKAPAQVAVMVRQMRYALDRQLHAKIEDPTFDLANDNTAAQVVSTIVKLLCDHDF
mmetsp:Transcript_3858/g.24473  ORF Transcript_3858/g.24473 Transcript_3858/m.24473 type:complete len:1409 (-) Transcript_3858:1730-5956(-)